MFSIQSVVSILGLFSSIIAILGLVWLFIFKRDAILLFLKTFFPIFIKKLPVAILTLWFVATLVFGLSKLAGDDMVVSDGRVDASVEEARREALGLNDPLWKQYISQVGPLMILDSQPSRIQRNKTIRTILKQHLPVSAELGIRAIFLALILGIPIGIIAALNHNGVVDKASTILALTGVSVPNFVIGSLVVYYFVRKLGWFQATEWASDPNNLWIPAAALGAFPFAAILRLTRASMLDALREDYIRTAKAKGLSTFKVVVKHALRNSLTSVVTYVGPVVAGILIGSLVIEKIFYIPGIGDMFVKSVSNRDTPLVLGISVFFCMMLIFMNLVVDSLYPVLNPKLRD